MQDAENDPRDIFRVSSSLLYLDIVKETTRVIANETAIERKKRGSINSINDIG